MGRMEKCELTVLCLLQRGDEILMQNRVKQDWRGYTLPGGHVEPGESIVDACVREMKEETGLDVKHVKLCGVKQFPIEEGRYLVFLFRSEDFSGELSSSEEGKVEWVKLSELSRYETVSDLKQLLEVMTEDHYSEFQYLVRDNEWIVNVR